MAPSAARVIYDHYGAEKFPSMKGLVESADRVDSADLEMEDVTDPKGWILLGFIMDPRTGLGRFRHFKISNYQLMMNMVDSIGQSSAEEVLALPDVKERVDLYLKQNEVFKNSLPNFSRLDGNVVVSDIRNLDEVPAGNRFLVYTVYPQCNVNLWVSWGFKKQNVAVATGYNIFNKTCQTDVGELMSEYGGGGHEAAGTCQLDTDKADALISEIVNKLKAKG
jgi:nanoRNase/pAp phosphatase (c-di-AMP/oligoRNAs hydrolase)